MPPQRKPGANELGPARSARSAERRSLCTAQSRPLAPRLPESTTNPQTSQQSPSAGSHPSLYGQIFTRDDRHPRDGPSRPSPSGAASVPVSGRSHQGTGGDKGRGDIGQSNVGGSAASTGLSPEDIERYREGRERMTAEWNKQNEAMAERRRLFTEKWGTQNTAAMKQAALNWELEPDYFE